MRIYRHRCNTVASLEGVAPGEGVEFDLRADGDRVIVAHDPFTDGPPLEDYLARVAGRPCIFNVKCDGIEERALSLAARHRVDDLFLLDVSLPTAARLARGGERRFAVRWSEHEPAALALAWAGRASWLWVDCFTAWPDDAPTWSLLAQRYAVCLVSPELQGHDAGLVPAWRRALGGLRVDAACTKRPDLWGGHP